MPVPSSILRSSSPWCRECPGQGDECGVVGHAPMQVGRDGAFPLIDDWVKSRRQLSPSSEAIPRQARGRSGWILQLPSASSRGQNARRLIRSSSSIQRTQLLWPARRCCRSARSLSAHCRVIRSAMSSASGRSTATLSTQQWRHPRPHADLPTAAEVFRFGSAESQRLRQRFFDGPCSERIRQHKS